MVDKNHCWQKIVEKYNEQGITTKIFGATPGLEKLTPYNETVLTDLVAKYSLFAPVLKDMLRELDDLFKKESDMDKLDHPEMRTCAIALLERTDNTIKDGIGFGKYDAKTVPAYLKKKPMSFDDATHLYRILKKYKKQLIDCGFVYEDIPEPKKFEMDADQVVDTIRKIYENSPGDASRIQFIRDLKKVSGFTQQEFDDLKEIALKQIKPKEKNLDEQEKEITIKERAIKILKGDDQEFKDALDCSRTTFSTIHKGDNGLHDTMSTSKSQQSILNSAGYQTEINGISGGGKSHAAKSFFHLIPGHLTLQASLSPQAMYYDDLIAGMTIFSDDTDLSEEMAGIIKRATTNYQGETIRRVADAKNNTVKILKIPPRINWVLTNIESSKSIQILNRQFGGDIDDSVKQDDEVAQFQLQKAIDGTLEYPITDNVLICRAIYQEISNQLFIVFIPFAAHIIWGDKKNRRNLPMFLDMIRGFAVFRFMQRELFGNELIANIDDFNEAQKLYASRAKNQTLKLNKKEVMIADYISKNSPCEFKDIQTATKIPQSSLYQTIHGRKDICDSGLLGKIPGLTYEKKSVKSEERDTITQKVFYTLTGYNSLEQYGHIVSLSEGAEEEYNVYIKNRHASQQSHHYPATIPNDNNNKINSSSSILDKDYPVIPPKGSMTVKDEGSKNSQEKKTIQILSHSAKNTGLRDNGATNNDSQRDSDQKTEKSREAILNSKSQKNETDKLSGCADKGIVCNSGEALRIDILKRLGNDKQNGNHIIIKKDFFDKYPELLDNNELYDQLIADNLLKAHNDLVTILMEVPKI